MLRKVVKRRLTFVDDDILKYMSDDEKDELQELMDRAICRMNHEDDPLFEEDRCISESGEDDRVEEDKEQTNLFEGEEDGEEEGQEEDFIKEVFTSGRLDDLFSLIRAKVLSMEYVAVFVQRPVIEVEELYELWYVKPGRIDWRG